ncbi:hypothetical protein Vadar_028409 [Vaccinium darrowii]|uniref:Uncharacterized protein n=1 Tax=Vaccinium darrowii TaxID=229202 RepID=A0ACB7YH47_9ERIC|nr:hypothetical protein Vadar_028409 [Vaccinium darrowii]
MLSEGQYQTINFSTDYAVELKASSPGQKTVNLPLYVFSAWETSRVSVSEASSVEPLSCIRKRRRLLYPRNSPILWSESFPASPFPSPASSTERGRLESVIQEGHRLWVGIESAALLLSWEVPNTGLRKAYRKLRLIEDATRRGHMASYQIQPLQFHDQESSTYI